jgi:lysophospholipase L1-like esterase
MKQREKFLSRSAASFTLLIIAGCASLGVQPTPQSRGSWITAWGASSTLPAANSSGFSNQTLRLIAHVAVGGNEVRVRIANTFGARPLVVDAAGIALQESAANLVAGSSHALTFSGRSFITVPVGAAVLSDAVSMTNWGQHDLAVSLYFSGDTGPITAHPMALQTSFVSGPGNFVAREDAAAFTNSISNWPYLVGVEVHSDSMARSIVAFGDSITDGYGSKADTNHRWPDILAARLLAAHQNRAVVNEGIGGNRIWHDAIATRLVFGPNGLSRFDRDALDISGASHVIVMLGINDIGHASPTKSPEEQVSADDIVAGLKQFALRAHARGIKIIGATLTPFSGAGYFDAAGEEKRQFVNAWIRSSPELDGVIDFDAAVRDPVASAKLQAAYDSGDHLHPSDAGYVAMAQSISLSLFD